MTKYFLRITGLALLWSLPFLGQAPTAAMADDATCCGTAGCKSCCDCCPHCGCQLVPVCHVYCTTKKETTYKYTCNCETICIPGVTPLCKGRSCEGSGQCAGASDTGSNGCQDGCGGQCCLHEVRKLVKHPVTKEVPVRTCTVEWSCPQCGGHGHCAEGAAPSASPAPAASPAPSASPTPSAPLPPSPGRSAAV